MKLPYFVEPATESEDQGEIRVLGKRFFCKDYAIFTMSQIRDRALLDLYKVMDISLNNTHNDKRNIYIMLLLKDDETVELLLIHSHLEDANIWNVTAISRILVELEYIMNSATYSRPTIELWDNYWEKLLISIHNSPYKFTKNPIELKNEAIDYGDNETSVSINPDSKRVSWFTKNSQKT